MGKFKKKNLIIAVCLTVALSAGMLGTGYVSKAAKADYFERSGYCLDIDAKDNSTELVTYSFSSGTGYEGKFPSSIKFTDEDGEKRVVKEESFIHYNDSSVSSYLPGLLVNMAELGKGYADFYSVKKGTLIQYSGNEWDVEANGHIVSFPELLFAVSEDSILAASDNLKVTLADNIKLDITGSVEIRYINKNFIQVLTNNKAYQVTSSKSRITYQSGAYVDLFEKVVYDGAGNAIFTIENLGSDMAGAIPLINAKASDWTLPTFNVENEDGNNGGVGQQGDIGQNGEQGEQGNTGPTGTDGTIGVNGSRGETGAAGGISGVTVEGDSDKLAEITIADINSSYSDRVTFKLSVADPDNTLSGNGKVEIRDAKTNQLVYSKAVDYSSSSLDESMLSIGANKLEADHEYIIYVKHQYTASINGFDSVSGSKIFLKRYFSTSSEGLSANVENVSADSLEIVLKKSSNYTSNNIAARIYVGNYYIDYPNDDPDGDVNESFPGTNKIAWEIKLGELLKNKYPEVSNKFNSNMDYRIEFIKDATLDSEENVVGEDCKLQLSGSTLKKTPEIGQIDVSTISEATGKYSFKVNIISDVDSAITEYNFAIYDSYNSLIDTVTSQKDNLTWYYGGYLPPDEYTVYCTVTAYDNEKTLLLKAKNGKIIATGQAGAINLSFSDYKKQGSKYIDKFGNTMASASSSDSSYGTNTKRIWGDLILKNGNSTRKLNADEPLLIQVRSVADSSFLREWSVTSTNRFNPSTGLYDKDYFIPIKMIDLKPDTEYIITVYGSVILNVSGNLENDYGYIGTITVKTR